MGLLDGKVALVTGGGRGIGAGISKRLGAEGALVAVHYGSSAEAAAETVAAIEAAGGTAFSVRAPLDDGDASALFQTLDSELTARTGSTSLDILVNNAGTSDQAELGETTPEMFDRLFTVNVRAALFIAQAAVERMGEGGRIIGMSSAVTDLAVPTSLVYSMTKAALVMMGNTLARELGPRGITVNTLAPGLVDTDMVSGWVNASEESRAQAASLSVFDRIGEPSDVASVVVLLCSDDGRWVTGQRINVGG
jgi:3-oxoacyl-[acyl-carrier protein] reductase